MRPALFTSTSISAASLAQPGHALVDRLAGAEVDPHRAHLLARRLTGGLLELLGRAHAGQKQAERLARQRLENGPADAAVGAGHERGPEVHVEVHVQSDCRPVPRAWPSLAQDRPERASRWCSCTRSGPTAACGSRCCRPGRAPRLHRRGHARVRRVAGAARRGPAHRPRHRGLRSAPRSTPSGVERAHVAGISLGRLGGAGVREDRPLPERDHPVRGRLLARACWARGPRSRAGPPGALLPLLRPAAAHARAGRRLALRGPDRAPRARAAAMRRGPAGPRLRAVARLRPRQPRDAQRRCSSGFDEIEVPITMAWADHDRSVHPPDQVPAAVHVEVLRDCGHCPRGTTRAAWRR